MLFPELSKKKGEITPDRLRELYPGARRKRQTNDTLRDLDASIETIVSSASGGAVRDPYYVARKGIADAFSAAIATRQQKNAASRQRDRLKKHADRFRSQAEELTKLFAVEPVRYEEQRVEKLSKKGPTKALAAAEAQRKKLWDAGDQIFKPRDVAPRFQAGITSVRRETEARAQYHIDRVMEAVDSLSLLADLAEAEITRLDALLAHDIWATAFIQALGAVYEGLRGSPPPLSKESNDFSDFVNVAMAVLGEDELPPHTIHAAIKPLRRAKQKHV